METEGGMGAVQLFLGGKGAGVIFRVQFCYDSGQVSQSITINPIHYKTVDPHFELLEINTFF